MTTFPALALVNIVLMILSRTGTFRSAARRLLHGYDLRFRVVFFLSDKTLEGMGRHGEGMGI
jgi:hypothetical protein